MKSYAFCLFLLPVFLLGCEVGSSRGSDRIISQEQLPYMAQNFLQRHFDGVEVKEVVCEQRASLSQYEVALKGGVDLQFDRNGVCTEVRCKKSAVPDAVMPDEIVRQIHEQFPEHFVMKYEHDSRIYDIELDDNTEVTFNRALRLIDVDRP